jgi:FkbM family methyltransferase
MRWTTGIESIVGAGKAIISRGLERAARSARIATADDLGDVRGRLTRVELELDRAAERARRAERLSGAPSAAPMHPDLIMDFGMHKGHDTAFYLGKGFRVVAVEANPALVAQARSRFAAEIAEGQLVIEAVGVGEKPGTATFYRNLDKDDWSSFLREYGAREGTRFEELEVECVRPQTIFERHGIPYYLKVDIEGLDVAVVRALDHFANRPRYVSIEERHASHFAELWAVGCRRFKIVDQSRLGELSCPLPPREGRYVPASFSGESSGPFGEEIPGDWMSFDEALEYYLTRIRSPSRGHLAGDSWFDIHGVVD